MTIVDNDAALMALLISDMEGVIDSITDQLLEKLKDLINENVYDVYDPQKYYRQGERGLGNEWEKSDPKISGKTVSSEIYENPMRLTVGPEYFVHGSQYWKIEDIRSILADIVIQGLSGPIFGEDGAWMLPRDFWTPFLKLLEDGTVEKIIESEFKSRGIKYKKI